MKVFGFVGFSGAGKTTLIEQLIPRLVSQGLRVSLMKHAHHDFDIDQPGKDSWRHRQAGATEVMITSTHRWVLMHELRGEPEPDLQTQLRRFEPCDLVLVEGYKRASIPKIAIHRAAAGRAPIQMDDPDVVAVATDTALDTRLPRLDLNDYDAIVSFILRHIQWTPRSP